MNRIIQRFFCLSTMVGWLTTTALAQSNKIETSAQTTAGGTASSSSFNHFATIGQSSPPGSASSTQFSLAGGFIFTLGNAPPAVANVIANQTLTAIGATFTRDLNASPVVFSDPDGDALTYTASSSNTAIATANVSGSMLTVAAVAVGNATITVTADDRNGNTISTTFSVTVSLTANQPPVVASALANQNLTAGGAPFVRDLNAAPAVFSDPDSDPLSYTASSSASTVATAAIAGSTLTVTPVAAGSATLTVTANDNKGGTVSTTFSVTVGMAANQPPTVANAIANQVLQLGGAPFTRDLNSPAVFTDPDGDPLTYTVNSSASNIATASIAGSTLTVTPLAGGTSTITVTANDGRGGSALMSFTARVNRAPQVINAIPNQSLTAVGQQFVRDINSAPQVFSDADGDALAYSITSSAVNVATAVMAISTLTVTSVGAGNATITITANDGFGGTASTSFGVSVTTTTGNQAPAIAHTVSPTPRPENQAISIQATITDDGVIAGAFLKYRQGGPTSPFDSTAMTRVGASSTFEGTIPANKTTGGLGVEYFIKAVDNGSPALTAFSPATGVFSLSIQVNRLSNLRDQPAAGALLNRAAYRLISIPLLLDNNPSAISILQAKFGAYDNTKWRLYGIDPARRQNTNDKSAYVEITSGGDLSSGKSLFLIVKEANQRLEAGPGRTLKTDGEFSINLDPGHNFIATPFNFTIPADKLRLSNNAPVVLWSYNGGSAFERATSLKEWEGNYIANNNPTAVTLLVNPSLGVSPRKMRAPSATGGWRLQIAASCGDVRDLENFAGVDAASVDSWDHNDVVEPPPFGDFVSLYFEHPEWEKVFHRYADDIRSAGNGDHRWTFRVDTNIPNEIVKLRFEGLASLAPELSVFLIDAELNYKQNLRERAAYQYQPHGSERPKDFTLLIGKADFIAAQTAGVQGVPENFVLEQNFPNPFWVGGAYLLQGEARTMIRFGLPAPSVVTIKIFDLAGREVATLLEKVEMSPGLHQRVWDGRDAQGRVVPNGIYFYRLAAGNVVRTMKMMVVR